MEALLELEAHSVTEMESPVGMDQAEEAEAAVAMVGMSQLTYHNPVGPEQLEPFALCGPDQLVASHLQMQDHLNFLEIT